MAVLSIPISNALAIIVCYHHTMYSVGIYVLFVSFASISSEPSIIHGSQLMFL